MPLKVRRTKWRMHERKGEKKEPFCGKGSRRSRSIPKSFFSFLSSSFWSRRSRVEVEKEKENIKGAVAH